MRRHLRLDSLAVLAILTAAAAARADGRPGVKEALALQAAVREAIARAEPAVACVIISRSDEYQKLQPLPSGGDQPGRLGGFDPSSIDDKRLARRLDLSDPEHVPEYYGSGVVIDASGLV